MDKKNLPFTLRNFFGDLSKRWYLEAIIDDKRVKKYGSINRYHTVLERLAAADELLVQLQNKPIKRVLRTVSFDWLENNKYRWRIKSYQTVKSKLTVFFDWLAGRALSSSALLNFLQHIGQCGRSRTTHNNYLRIFKMVNTECWKIKDLFDEVRPLRAEAIPAKYFTRTQIDFLRDKLAALNPEVLLFAQFQYFCFIRPGELRLLRVDDIALDEARILIRGAISKNRKEQYVCIPAAFVPVLEAALIGRNPSDYVFGGLVPHCKDFIAKKHQTILKGLHFDTARYKLYSWKHTGAVAAVRAGVHIKELQIQLRHHSLDQVNAYLRQLGVTDLEKLAQNFPAF
jgi:integrase